MANFKIEKNRLVIGGDLSIASGDALLEALRNVQVSNKQFLIDLSGVELWDSSTVQVFVSFVKTHPRGVVIWRNMPEAMRSDIELMGLSALFSEGENG